MKRILCLIALLLACAVLANSGKVSSSSDSADFDPARWQIKDPNGRVVDHLGRKSLYLKSGFAFMNDLVFEDGVIEVDMAPPTLRSFMGIVFRFENADDHEIVYFRPHKSGLEDAAQYTPSFNGSACWQLYSGKGFTAAVEIPKAAVGPRADRDFRARRKSLFQQPGEACTGNHRLKTRVQSRHHRSLGGRKRRALLELYLQSITGSRED